MLVNAIATQGDATYGPNYYTDFKIQYSFDASPATGTLFTIKEEASSTEKVRNIFSNFKFFEMFKVSLSSDA